MSLLPSSSLSTTLLGMPFPPPLPPTSSHPLLTGASLVPLRVLICNFTKRTHDHFHDLLEQLEQQPDELQRRHALLASVRQTQVTLTRLRLLTSWLLEHGEEHDRLGDMATVLKQRDAAYGLSVDMLNLLARHVDTSLPPAYDVPTAIHVLGRGDYRLLPRQIESVLDVKRVLSDTEIADIKRRLDDQLYIALLSSRLPPLLTVLTVKGGVARLGAGGWVATVSLRMMPRGETEVPEQSRIKWRLFGIRWLLHISGDPADVAVLADAQTAALIGRCNALMHSSDEPLLLLYKTLQTFVHTLTLALLNHQVVSMQQHYAAQAITVDFIPGQSLAIRYWKEAQLIPQGDVYPSTSTTAASSTPAVSSSSLLFTLNGDQLNVSHSPPLPQMEAAGAEAASTVSFTIDPQSISFSRLFVRMLASHARHRIQQLHAFLLRQTKTANQPPWDSIAVVSREGESEQGTEEEDLDDSEADQHALVHEVLAIALADGWTVHVRVDQQSGRFVFSWADVLPFAASASSALALSLSTLASLSNLSTLFTTLHSLRHEARLLYYQRALSSLHTGPTVLRFLPIQWTATIASPAAASEASLMFVRLSSSPYFFLLLSFPLSDAGLPPSLYFLHCEHVELPSPANATSAPTIAAGVAPKRKVQYCELLSPVSCKRIPNTDLPKLTSLPPTLSTGLSLSTSPHLPLIHRALWYCEERVPAAVFLHQLSHLPATNVIRLSATSFAFSTPFPPAPSKPSSEARITVTIAPHVPYNHAPTSSLLSVARYYPASNADNDALLVSGVRYGWSAVIEQPSITHMYRELLKQKVDVHSRSLGMHLIHSDDGTAGSSASSTSCAASPIVCFYYASMTASPLSSVFKDVMDLFMCVKLTDQAFSCLSIPLDRFRQYDAMQPGDQPPPGFFAIASCSTDLYSIRYNLDRLDREGGSDECWVLLKPRHADLESNHYLNTGRRAVVATVHFSPYAFPHHDYLEWDFNHRFDINTLLKHVYWGGLAAKHIHRFMQRVCAWDRAAGYHHLHFHQTISFAVPEPSTLPGQPPVQQTFLLSVSPTVHTVNVVPESATRVRFLFRRQYKQTKVDIRLLNGHTFIQDFLSTPSSVAGGVDENRQAPGKLPMRNLETFLSSWYQWCGQYEQWKRITKQQQVKQFTLPVSFDKMQLGSRPTDKMLIDIRIDAGSGLRTDEVDVLCRFYRQWVCVPPYSPECMHSFLQLCTLPLGVAHAMLELLQLQLASHDPATATATGRLTVRWVHHLSSPFDLHYQPSHDVLFIIVQLTDRERGESVYLPLAHTVSTGMVALWENDNQETVLENRSMPENRVMAVRNERRLRRLLPVADGAPVGYGPTADEWVRREQWSSFGAAVSVLMALEMGEVVQLVTSSMSPPLSVDEWCQQTTETLVSAEFIKAEAARTLEAAAQRHQPADIALD